MTKTKKNTITKFGINLHCAIISTNIAFNKKYILSVDKNTIKLPMFKLDMEAKEDIDQFLIKNLRDHYIFVNELELSPQLISLHYPSLASEKNSLDTLYGFLVNHTQNINNSKWIEFDYLDSNPSILLLCDVIQRLR